MRETGADDPNWKSVVQVHSTLSLLREQIPQIRNLLTKHAWSSISSVLISNVILQASILAHERETPFSLD